MARLWQGSRARETEEQLARLEAEIAELKPSLGARLSALEAAAAAHSSPMPPPRRGFLTWMGDEAPKLVAAVVLLIITYWIKDSVDLALRRQQLQLETTKGMESHLESMAKPNAAQPDIDRAALLLAAYGQASIIPLVNELREKGARAQAAEGALGLVALSDPEDLCKVLPGVLANRTGLFGWESHLRVIRLLGGSGCSRAKDDLRRYQMHLENVRAGKDDSSFFELISDKPAPDALDQLHRALTKTLEQLGRTPSS